MLGFCLTSITKFNMPLNSEVPDLSVSAATLNLTPPEIFLPSFSPLRAFIPNLVRALFNQAQEA